MRLEQVRVRGYLERLSGAISMLSDASPPGGRRGQAVTKSRNFARSTFGISTSSSSSSCTATSFLLYRAPCSLPTSFMCCSSDSLSHSIRLSPHSRSSISAGLKIWSPLKGNTSLMPARNASICLRTPVSNQSVAVSSMYSPRRSTVRSRWAPPSHSGAPDRWSTNAAPEVSRNSPSEHSKVRFSLEPMNSRARTSATTACRTAGPCPALRASTSSQMAAYARRRSIEVHSSMAGISSRPRPNDRSSSRLWYCSSSDSSSRSPLSTTKKCGCSGSGSVNLSRHALPNSRPMNRNCPSTSAAASPGVSAGSGCGYSPSALTRYLKGPSGSARCSASWPSVIQRRRFWLTARRCSATLTAS
mmetsp:Transcript_14000/g.33236  ORF Transcript_14000/g.33236 Transcript_14000/m.33236 type:complete len:359 (+) Transcript_14000:239-1315(+)